jgi:hypothetical protein
MTTQTEPVSTPAIAAAKAAAADTDYVRAYGPDPTYWTHFLRWQEATAADWNAALEVVLATAPEATVFIDHLRGMREIASAK